MKTIKNQGFSSTTAGDFGDKVWAVIYTRRADCDAEELTQQKNWWPEFYRHACDVLGWKHDPRIDAYEEGSFNTRADLERMGASA
jgi:hypothetical protein